MRLPRVRFTVRRIMIAIAVLAILTCYVVVPTWDYFRLPPETRVILGQLHLPFRSPSPGPMPLDGLLKATRVSSAGTKSIGIPIYVDPNGLAEAGASIDSTVQVVPGRMPIGEALHRSLEPLRLGYFVRDGLLTVTSVRSADQAMRNNPKMTRRP